MSGALGYPTMSDNRSFISDHARFHSGNAFLYAHEYDDQRKTPVSRYDAQYRTIPTSSNRQLDSPLASIYHDPGRVHNGGAYGSSPDVNTSVPFSQGVPQPSYRDRYPQMTSSSYYSSSSTSFPYTYPQPPRIPDTPSIASHSSSSHSPSSTPTQQLSSPIDEKPVLAHTAHRAVSKRREKPRIALAPDQPLTTQGKPRARVYLACVQW